VSCRRAPTCALTAALVLGALASLLLQYHAANGGEEPTLLAASRRHVAIPPPEDLARAVRDLEEAQRRRASARVLPPRPSYAPLLDRPPTQAGAAGGEGDACSAHVLDLGTQVGYVCGEHAAPGGRRQCCCTVSSPTGMRPPWPAHTCLPSLLIVGAQKGGTTALMGYLLHHTAFVPALRKELHVFDKEAFFEGEALTPAGFRALLTSLPSLPPATGTVAGLPYSAAITGEASPSYMLGLRTAARIAAALPRVRVIALLREPAARAWSEWSMKARRVAGQARLDEPSSLAPVLAAVRQCVGEALLPLLRVALEAGVGRQPPSLAHLSRLLGPLPTDDALAAATTQLWWTTAASASASNDTAAPLSSPRDLARTCVLHVLGSPPLKPLGRCGVRVVGVTASCLVDSIGPPPDAAGGLFSSLARAASGALQALRGAGGEREEGAVEGGCGRGCYGPLLSSLLPSLTHLLTAGKSGRGRGGEAARSNEADAAAARCFAVPGRPRGGAPADPGPGGEVVSVRYEDLTPWEEVVRQEGSRLRACAAAFASVGEAVQAAGGGDTLTPGGPAGPAALLADGTPTCWPGGSSSNIAMDYLYRGVYVGQVARLHAALGRERVLVLADTVLRREPQAALDAATAHAGLEPMDVSAVGEAELEDALEGAFPAFKATGWLLDGGAAGTGRLPAADAASLRALFAPFDAALVGWLEVGGGGSHGWRAAALSLEALRGWRG
jgi:hypothetical protein